MRRSTSRAALSRRIPLKRSSRLDFATQPIGTHVETVRPGRRAILQEYACEVCGIAQRLNYRAGLGNQSGEIVLARRSVAKRRMQTVAAEAFEFGDPNHGRVLRREPPPQPSPAKSGRGSAPPLL